MKYVLLYNSHNNSHKNDLNRLFYKSIFVSYRMHAMSYIVFWGIFLHHEHRMQITFIVLLENTMNYE